MSRKILSYCRITNKHVLVDGKLILSNNENNINHWISDIYNYIKLSYPKYHKMDHLCKAGILAAEMVMEKLGLNNDELKTDWAICCMSRSGSLDNDTSYQETIQNNDDFYPAPSLFVYTLSNIVLGEIAIKYKLRCESSCYVCEKFSSENIFDSVNDVYNYKPVNYILSGWLEYGIDGCDILLFAVGDSDNENLLDFTPDNLDNIYKENI